MTHDELLAKIDGIKPLNSPAWNMQNALRAVVELHKPNNLPTTMSMKNGGWVSNTHCHDCHSVYPCPTIQAIKKELA